MTDPVDRNDRQPIGDRMPSLYRHPSAQLTSLFLVRITALPADRCWIDQQVRATHRHQASGFRIPLIPANQDAKPSDGSIDRLKSQIARREVELLIISGIIRNVHLTILAGNRAITFQYDRRVVIQPRRPALEKGEHEDNPQLPVQLTEGLRRRSLNRFRQIK